MKKILFSISIMLVAKAAFGQWIWEINFEDTTRLKRVIINSVSSRPNIWQIGRPNKIGFNSAYSTPNAIVTDTINTYPANDTSSFTIIHIAQYGWAWAYPKVDIGGWYFVNSDSLTDFGYVEFSPDLGSTWYLADSASGNCTWGAVQNLPTFTGNSNGWKHFYYCLNVPFPVSKGDTILYRFSFVSDSIQTNKAGLMIDDLHFEDWVEDIQEIQNDNLILLYPNPAHENIFIRNTKSSQKQSVQIFDYTGQVVYVNENFTGQPIDTRNWTPGIYWLKYSDRRNLSFKKFSVQH